MYILTQLRKDTGAARVLADGQAVFPCRVDIAAENGHGIRPDGPGLIFFGKPHGPFNVGRKLPVCPDAEFGNRLGNLRRVDDLHGLNPPLYVLFF